MNDLELLRELGALTRLPEPGELAAARARVLSGCTQERRGVRGRRFVIGGVAVAVAAAIVAGILVWTQTPAAPPAITAHLTAEQVLDRAAAAALKRPTVTPRPDQFVYIKKYDSGATQQSWASVDGTRNGLLTENNGMREILSGCAAGQRCTPVPAYFPSIPHTRPGIVAWLKKMTGNSEVDSPATYGSAVTDVLNMDYLSSAQQYTLYRFLADSHLFTAVPSATNALGRSGVGVAWTINDVTFTLIFDPSSYVYLGNSEGIPHSGIAIERVAIVDHAGELPAQSS